MGRDTELITLIKAGSIDGVKKYLSKLKKSGSAKKLSTINSQNEEGLSALHLCSMQNQLDLLNDLLELKASVDLKDNRGLTPLHYAAFRGNFEAAYALLEFNANPCSVANSKETPLHVAAQYGHSNVMSVLVDFQANPLMCNESKQTPLDVACFMGHTKAVKVLLETRYFPCRYTQGQSLVQSPMHMCAKQGHTEILKMLLERGYSVDEMGPNGTPLHEAALYGRVDVVKLLVQLGCDQNMKNSQSQTAMDLVHKFTNPRAYTSRQILQALSQARPVAIPRPPSVSQSGGNPNCATSPHFAQSVNSLPSYAHIPETDTLDTPVRTVITGGMQTEQPELIMSPVPDYNEYEGAAEPNNFASMIAQAAVIRKGSLASTRKVSNHNHFPSDPVERMASLKSTKRESSNSSTDTSFSTTSNSGFSTGVSTPDRYQSPSPANMLPSYPTQHSRPAFQTEYPSNDYDIPDEMPQPVSMSKNLSLIKDLYDTPSPNSKHVEIHSDFSYQVRTRQSAMIEYSSSETVLRKIRTAKLAKLRRGERGGAPPVSKPTRQRPADSLPQTQTESSIVMKKLSSLPAGFNDVSAPNNMPLYGNQSVLQEAEALRKPLACQPVAMETAPPRPMSKPKVAPKSVAPPAEKQHMSELQEKLVLRKIASETASVAGVVISQPPPPPTSSPPILASPQAVMPPKKPPREPQAAHKPAVPLPEEGSSPEEESDFLEALKAKRGSLKRSNTIQPFSPPHAEAEMPSRPPNPPRPISGHMEPPCRLPSPESLRDIVPSYQQRCSTLAPMKRSLTEIGIGTNPSETESKSHPRTGTIVSKISSTDSWPLEKFLSALKLSDYLPVLAEAGYAESADFVGLSADEVTQAGVSKAGHKKKLLTSIQSLTATHAGFQHIPNSIETWLTQWNLLSYQNTLIDSGYDDLEFIADMTVDELRELGIDRAPVLKRFSLALSHLHDSIQSHRSLVLSGSAHNSPQVTPQKPTVTSQLPTTLKECSNIPSPVSNHYDNSLDKTPENVPTPESKLQRKPSNTTPPSRPSEDSLTPTQLSSPVTPPTQQLRKPAAPGIAKKPGIPPPVSKKPFVERRNSKPLPSPDQLPEYPSPQRGPTGRQDFPSPLRTETNFPSPLRTETNFPSPLRTETDFPPPPPAVRNSFFPDFPDDLPPPPPEMSLPLDDTPPPPPLPDSHLQPSNKEEKNRRLSGLADLDDLLSSMGSDDVKSPAPLLSPPPPQQRSVQSSEVLNDIDQMLANLNLEIDNLMTDP